MMFPNRLFFTLLLAAATSGLTAQTLSGPESVEFHPRSGRILVSNKNAGEILWRASNGTLSLFTSDPTSPYGIEFLRGVVFALDSGKVKGYDIDSGLKVFDLTITGASFLNGITSDGDHRLYITDFTAKKLIRVDVTDLLNPVQTPLETLTQTPNGVVFDRANNRLLIATWGTARVLTYDIANGGVPQVLVNVTGYTNIDGIALDCSGSIYVTPWSCPGGGGCLRRIDPPFTLTSPAVTVGPALGSPADIDFGNRSGEIAVPESSSNAVTLVPSTGCPPILFADDFER